MRDLREVRLEAFHDELKKYGSTWYNTAGKSVANFGKRQLHALTGWTPHGFLNHEAGQGAKWIEEIGAGAGPARLRHAVAEEGPAKELATQALGVNERAQHMGLTSIPGFARSLWNDPGETLRAGFNQQWHGTTGKEKAFMVGLPLAATALTAASADDPENPHKGRDLGAGIAGTAVGMVTGTMPVVTGMAVGEAASRAGGAVGGVVDKIRKRRRQLPPLGQLQPPPEEARGQHVPTERVLSPAAAGQMPEVT